VCIFIIIIIIIIITTIIITTIFNDIYSAIIYGKAIARVHSDHLNECRLAPGSRYWYAKLQKLDLPVRM